MGLPWGSLRPCSCRRAWHRFVVCVGSRISQRLLGAARQQGCSTGVLGSAANNLVENHRQYLSTGLSTDRALSRVPRGRHRVLPRLVARERYFREGKCREENHGTSPRDGGPDAIDDTRQQYLPAVQCTFACTRLVGTCQRAPRTTRLVVRRVWLRIRDDGRLSVREVKSWAVPPPRMDIPRLAPALVCCASFDLAAFHSGKPDFQFRDNLNSTSDAVK